MFSTDNKTKIGIIAGSLIILTIIVIILVVVHKKEGFDSIQREEPTNLNLQAKNVQLTAASEKPFQGSTAERINDMLGNNIVPNQDIKIYQNQERILEVNTANFINDSQQCDSAKQYAVSNWATKQAQLASIKEQVMAQKGYGTPQEAKEQEAYLRYVFDGGNVPDAYEKYVFGAKSTAPIIDPSLIAYGQSRDYTGVSQKVQVDSVRRQKLNETVGQKMTSQLVQ